jgi:nitric oxide reductase subunit B
MQQPLLQTLRWARTFGDLVFIVGALSMAWQVVTGVLSPSGKPVKVFAEGGVQEQV